MAILVDGVASLEGRKCPFARGGTGRIESKSFRESLPVAVQALLRRQENARQFHPIDMHAYL